ncbi:MAG: hypothetical protein ACREON_06485 [Gemmatimonadaceae bacterium]
MRRIFLGVAITAIGLAAPSVAAAQAQGAPEGRAVTLTADVVDLSCKVVNNASGPDHLQCAQVCADKGQPLGLLTADGTLYVPVNAGMGADGENKRLRPLAEQRVKVTGRVINRAGMNAIVIDKVEKA